MGFYSFFIFFLICIAFQNVIPLHFILSTAKRMTMPINIYGETIGSVDI